MVVSGSPAQLSADSPITSSAQDRLGRARFARLIAHAASAMAPPDGIVLGLHGGAGAGRTSVANLVCEQLSVLPDVRLVRFDPAPPDRPGRLAERFASELGTPSADGAARALVVIDDVDRLSGDELAELSGLIRGGAAASEPSYLVVFDRLRRDRDEVARLVQVAFDLPPPETGSLQSLFLDQLAALLEQHPAAAVVTEHHWTQMFSPGIESLLRTPRDVVRLVNTLRITYPPLAREVNTADFIAIEALRLFEPALYDRIRRTPARFAGSTRPRTVAGVDDETKAYHDEWIEALDPVVRLGVLTLVLRLFPALPDVQGMIIHRDAPGDTVRQELRVASPELFVTYFQFRVPETTFSNAEMEAFVQRAHERDGFVALLGELHEQHDQQGRSRAVAFLDRLADEAPQLDPEVAAAAIGGLLDVGDALDAEMGDQVRRLLDVLLARFDRTVRAEILNREFRRGRAVGLIVALVTRMGREHGRHGGEPELPDERRAVTLDDLAGLERIALERIRETAASGELLQVPGLAAVLDRWRVWDRTGSAAWVERVSSDDATLATLVAAFMRRVVDPVTGELTARVDPDWIRPVIAPEAIADRVRRIAAAGSAAGDQRVAVEAFVQEYDGDLGAGGRRDGDGAEG